MNLNVLKRGKRTLSNFLNSVVLGNESRTGIKSYGVFISHAWEYGMEYILLLETLYSVNNLEWHNCSSPKFELIRDSGVDLVNDFLPGLLRKQIGSAHCVLIISDMYMKNSYWIQKQIDFALELGKPIIAVKSRSLLKISDNIKKVAYATVDWNAQSLVQAIRSSAS